MTRIPKIVLRLLVIVAILYIIFGVVLFIFQRDLIYFPTAQDFNACPELPADILKVTHQGTRMYVHKATDNWVIVYHGNAGSACDRSYYLDYFDTTKFSYILVEYAGYSNGTENPSQDALMENVRAVEDYLQKEKAVKKTILGESLGTALAAYHSSISNPDKLILISPFDSLEHVSQSLYWYYPITLLLLDTYPSMEWTKNTNNVLIIHGTNDTIVPIKFGKSLFDTISGNNKDFVEIPGADHNDIFNFPKTSSTIADFIRADL